MWSYFEAIGIAKELNPTVEASTVRLWWKPSSLGFDQLNAFLSDKDAAELASYALENKAGVDIFVEQKKPEKENKGKDIAIDDEDYSETEWSGSESSCNDLHFSDSEEERTVALDDDFLNSEDDADYVLPEDGVNTDENPSSAFKRSFKSQEVHVTPQLEAAHVIEEDYLSDYLDSASESDDEENPKPKIIRFHPEDMCKNFKFEVGEV